MRCTLYTEPINEWPANREDSPMRDKIRNHEPTIHVTPSIWYDAFKDELESIGVKRVGEITGLIPTDLRPLPGSRNEPLEIYASKSIADIDADLAGNLSRRVVEFATEQNLDDLIKDADIIGQVFSDYFPISGDLYLGRWFNLDQTTNEVKGDRSQTRVYMIQPAEGPLCITEEGIIDQSGNEVFGSFGVDRFRHEKGFGSVRKIGSLTVPKNMVAAFANTVRGRSSMPRLQYVDATYFDGILARNGISGARKVDRDGLWPGMSITHVFVDTDDMSLGEEKLSQIDSYYGKREDIDGFVVGSGSTVRTPESIAKLVELGMLAALKRPVNSKLERLYVSRFHGIYVTDKETDPEERRVEVGRVPLRMSDGGLIR